jgi:hypothetical protein
LKKSIETGGRADGPTGRRVVLAAVLLTVSPSARLPAQGVLNQFSYENLRLSGIQLDVGVLGASELTGATVGGVRVDYGRIAPRVRLLLGLSYFRSRFDQQSLRRFEQRLDSIVNPGTTDNINVGRISLGDFIGDIDFQLVFPQGRGITAYVGVGVSIHARNGSGAAINGTFVEDALDVITAGANGTMGFEFNLSPAWRFTIDGRGMLSSGLRTASVRTGLMYRLKAGREQGAGSRGMR